jgi:hypothetical protein
VCDVVGETDGVSEGDDETDGVSEGVGDTVAVGEVVADAVADDVCVILEEAEKDGVGDSEVDDVCVTVDDDVTVADVVDVRELVRENVGDPVAEDESISGDTVAVDETEGVGEREFVCDSDGVAVTVAVTDGDVLIVGVSLRLAPNERLDVGVGVSVGEDDDDREVVEEVVLVLNAVVEGDKLGD